MQKHLRQAVEVALANDIQKFCEIVEAHGIDVPKLCNTTFHGFRGSVNDSPRNSRDWSRILPYEVAAYGNYEMLNLLFDRFNVQKTAEKWEVKGVVAIVRGQSRGPGKKRVEDFLTQFLQKTSA